MPKIIVGLGVAMLGTVLNIGAAQSGTVYSGVCATSSQNSNKGYYVVDYFSDAAPYQISAIPSISTVYKGCTAGTYYKILPQNYNFPTSSAFYGTSGIVYSCSSCVSGYELQTISGPFLYADVSSGSNEVMCTSVSGATIKYCVPSGSSSGTCSSSNCVSGNWYSHSTGYVSRDYRYCSSGTCVTETQYACDYGYFGNSGSTSASGCTKCPPLRLAFKNLETGNVGYHDYPTTTPYVAMTSLTGCYVIAEPNVTEFVDTAGTFVMGDGYGSLTNSCYLSYGQCNNVVPVCNKNTASGIQGIQTAASGGTVCWCNIPQTGKSFKHFDSAACSSACTTSACLQRIMGHSASGYAPTVSLTDLGC